MQAMANIFPLNEPPSLHASVQVLLLHMLALNLPGIPHNELVKLYMPQRTAQAASRYTTGRALDLAQALLKLAPGGQCRTSVGQQHLQGSHEEPSEPSFPHINAENRQFLSGTPSQVCQRAQQRW